MQANRRVAVFGAPEAELLEAASELEQGLVVAHGKAVWDAQDVELAQLSSGDDISPQRRPERRSEQLSKTRSDSDLGQVRSYGSDELSEVCCIEVAKRGSVSGGRSAACALTRRACEPRRLP